MATLHRSKQEPNCVGLSTSERWSTRESGLIYCWERGREKRAEDPELARSAERGELPILAWAGGVVTKLKSIDEKLAPLNYWATWQGLRDDDLNIPLDGEYRHTCQSKIEGLAQACPRLRFGPLPTASTVNASGAATNIGERLSLAASSVFTTLSLDRCRGLPGRSATGVVVAFRGATPQPPALEGGKGRGGAVKCLSPFPPLQVSHDPAVIGPEKLPENQAGEQLRLREILAAAAVGVGGQRPATRLQRQRRHLPW